MPRLWDLSTDALPLQDATDLAGDLGIEHDTPEHDLLERSQLCAVRVIIPLKRKRQGSA